MRKSAYVSCFLCWLAIETTLPPPGSYRTGALLACLIVSSCFGELSRPGVEIAAYVICLPSGGPAVLQLCWPTAMPKLAELWLAWRSSGGAISFPSPDIWTANCFDRVLAPPSLRHGVYRKSLKLLSTCRESSWGLSVGTMPFSHKQEQLHSGKHVFAQKMKPKSLLNSLYCSRPTHLLSWTIFAWLLPSLAAVRQQTKCTL